MRLSEVSVLVLLAAGVFGLVVVVARREPPEPRVPESVVRRTAESDFMERCGEVGYGAGQPPRVDSISGDTIVMRIDLDTTRFTQPQANLFVTRLLREHGYAHRATYRREDGGLSFRTERPDGYPLRIEIKRPGP
jgi:hypothetical protein